MVYSWKWWRVRPSMLSRYWGDIFFDRICSHFKREAFLYRHRAFSSRRWAFWSRHNVWGGVFQPKAFWYGIWSWSHWIQRLTGALAPVNCQGCHFRVPRPRQGSARALAPVDCRGCPFCTQSPQPRQATGARVTVWIFPIASQPWPWYKHPSLAPVGKSSLVDPWTLVKSICTLGLADQVSWPK